MTKSRHWRKSSRSIVSTATVLLLTTLATGCSSLPRSTPAGRPLPAPEPARHSPEHAGFRSNAIEELAGRVVQTARSLLDTPYRYSGSDPGGFDCSGLASYVYASAGVELPRTAASQARVGSWVAPDELLPGDLVFFGEKRSRPFHVGVVVSVPGEPLTMIHSATSSGVIETEILSDSYWLPRLKFGRRALGTR